MPFVNVTTREGETHRLDATLDSSLMEALRDSGKAAIIAMCGGCCACATCHVYVDDDWVERTGKPREDEVDMLSGLAHLTSNSRLSCQIVITETLDGLSVRVAPEE
jgi:2Fe-2S ferredoxin